MRLKRIFLTATTVISSVLCISASVQKEPENVKIYINPGHGAYNSSCRPMGTVKHGAFNSSNIDTTGFFESNTNLWKALALFHKLKEGYGVPHSSPNARDLSQNIVMSHITCGTDRSLSEIAAEVEQYQPDVFLSIHSNASPDGTIGNNENYPLLLYRGEDYKPNAVPAFGDETFDYATGSYEFGKALWPHLKSIEHEPYTDEWRNQWDTEILDPTSNVRGDVDFMYNLKKYHVASPDASYTTSDARGSGVTNSYSGKKYYGYYGVLKHGYVGILSEGYMHTYYPSVNRHMNRDVCAIEGIAYAHGIADYFGWEKENTGYIYGIVRDRNVTFSHTYYIPNQNSDDIYKPINNATVKLYKNGVLIDTYVTDDEYNGAFVFYNLEPGDYTLDYSCDGYSPASEGLKATTITVTANEISYPKAFLSSESYSMSSGISMSTTPIATHSTFNWYGGSSTNQIFPRQIAVSNDVVYLIMVGGSRISYWNATTNEEGSFTYGTNGANGHGICTDDNGNLIFASGPGYTQRIQQVTVLPKSSSPGVLVSTTNAKTIDLNGKYNTVLSGRNASGTTTYNSSGISNVIRASGNCYNGIGALWLTNGREVVKIPIVNGVAQTEVVYNTPLSDSSFSGSFGGSHNENWAKESNFFPYADGKYIMQNRNGMFLCTLSDNTVDGFEYVENTWYPYNAADIEYIGGHEIIVHQANAGLTRDGKITVIDRTTGETLANAINAYGSSATLPTDAASVNAWCEFDIIDDYTLALYTYVPNNGLAKYIIKYNIFPDEPCSDIAAIAELTTNFNQNIAVTWSVPTSWTKLPTNYLVKYQTSYINAEGNTISSEWQNAGLTDGPTCEFIHKNVSWATDEENIYPQTYSYIVIPNFDCYDGCPSDKSNPISIDFAAPSPQWENFDISAVYDGDNILQYDATTSWIGINVDGNEQYSLNGYKIEIYADDDTNKEKPISSLTFFTNDNKYYGAINTENGEGAMLDASGNEIKNLSYCKVTDYVDSISIPQYLYKYKLENIPILDSENNVRTFTAYATALFTGDNSSAYSTSSFATTTPKYVGGSTGIETITEFNRLNIYPIPTSGSLTINSHEPISTISIHSTAGRLMKKIQGNKEYSMTISVEDLSKGIYVLGINNIYFMKITKD